MKGTLAQKEIEYATNSLHDIALAYIGEGKLDGLTGADDIKNLPVETQLEYCSRDCELIKILQEDDYRILRLEHSISKLIKQDFLVTCRYLGHYVAFGTYFLIPTGSYV